MASLTNCEFMVKGYHYTEPTTPIRTDSCRLYLDTDIDGEESSVENEIWEVPSTAYLHPFVQDSVVLNSLTGDIGGRQASVSPDIPNLQDDDILSFTNLPTGTATNGPITVKEIKENYTSSTNPFDSSLAAYFYYSNNIIFYVLQRHSSTDPEIIDPTIVRNANRPYLLHLKGIHGFYVQT